MTIALDKSIDTILATRKLFIKLIENLSIEQLNKVPEGFNNNIIWNFAHVVVTQQIICYKLSGLPLKIDEKYLPLYSKGTKPEGFADENEVAFFNCGRIGSAHWRLCADGLLLAGCARPVCLASGCKANRCMAG